MEDNQTKKRNIIYLIVSLLLVFIVIPAVAQLAMVGYFFIEYEMETQIASQRVLEGLYCLFIVLFLGGAGFLYGRYMRLSDRSRLRYLPFLLPVYYVIVLWIISVFLSGGDITEDIFSAFYVGMIPFFLAILVTVFSGKIVPLLLLGVVSYLSFFIAFIFAVKKRGLPLLFTQKTAVLVSLSLAGLFLLASYQWHQRTEWLLTSEVRSEENFHEEVDLHYYHPLSSPNGLTPLRTDPTLSFTENYPVLDGATAAYPLYASAVKALYKHQTTEQTNALRSAIFVTTTPYAYQNLIDGKVELIFAARPSPEQIKQAEEKGLKFELIPLAREAFVFLVNQDNPVGSLTVEQIQSVFTGRIDNWKRLGGADEKIIAFQRPAGSGSQTVMENVVMKGLTMKLPLKEESVASMGGLVYRVASYRNVPNALGYSFRYYATKMNSRENLKLLAINGIEPTVENIRSKRYPFTVDVYMVTAKKPGENTQKLIDWFLSPQGQQLVEDVGYVPLN